jgi:hypothetical protein
VNLLRVFFPKVEGPSPEAQISTEAILKVARHLMEDAAKLEADAAERAAKEELHK